ncbi:CHAT domain-containing protein [Pseudanabaena sp. PCC 6802]|uniref:CHAT domain-containing protein n=1 Tax=Pseudanabaena sp. PCC 6802 TaxID=118173 RepID=UPI00034841FC|nr:CHAT domain-containing protein [Pseudanabaena sp. PCC 6802]
MLTKLCRQVCSFVLIFAIGLLLCVKFDNLIDAAIDHLASNKQNEHYGQVLAQPISISPRSPSSQNLLAQGIKLYRMGKYKAAIARWEQALALPLTVKDKADIHNNLAQAYRQIGQTELAIAQWQQAIAIYRADNFARPTRDTLLAAALIEQAQMYSDLGQDRNGIAFVQEAIAIAQRIQDRKLEAAGLGVLGNAYWRLGQYDGSDRDDDRIGDRGSNNIPANALDAHTASLQIARQLSDPTYAIAALNNRGNTYFRRAERYRWRAEAADLAGETKSHQRFRQLAEDDERAARQDYQASVQLSHQIGGMPEVQALLDLNQLLTRTANPDRVAIQTNRDRILSIVQALPDSQDKAFILTRLAMELQQQNPNSSIQYLTQAIATARSIEHKRAESFALGSLGHVYETLQQYDRALDLTRQAQNIAQVVNASDSLYRWQWQAGRILKNTNELEAAISAYRGAIATLQTIRSDLISADREQQFNFRDSVEPVYRELIDLLLSEVPSSIAPNPNRINEALNTLELLKLAELQNFFGDECVQVARDRAKASNPLRDPKTAIIYSIVLDRHTVLVLRSPGTDRLKRYTVKIAARDLRSQVDRLRQLLENQATEEYLPVAQQVYDLLIRPLETDLAAIKPDTLVFIQDGDLRKLPMSALHDGQKFSIEKYAIATTPSLELTALTAPTSDRDRAQSRALILGVTAASPPFAALPNVAMETSQVQQIMGGTAFIDTEFTLERLTQHLRNEDYRILHIATHGKFGASPADTFLVGGNNTRINIVELDKLIGARKYKQAIELLTLSACQTATGDNRSTLGMAGIAVRSGAVSAIATLWFINDESTVPLIAEFYQQFRHANITKAEALRRAQMKLISDRDYNHPAIWSPFILIGSWL